MIPPCELGLAGGAAVQLAALLQQLRPCGTVDGPVYAAPAQQGLVGGVDDAVGLRLGDVHGGKAHGVLPGLGQVLDENALDQGLGQEKGLAPGVEQDTRNLGVHQGLLQIGVDALGDGGAALALVRLLRAGKGGVYHGAAFQIQGADLALEVRREGDGVPGLGALRHQLVRGLLGDLHRHGEPVSPGHGVLNGLQHAGGQLLLGLLLVVIHLTSLRMLTYHFISPSNPVNPEIFLILGAKIRRKFEITKFFKEKIILKIPNSLK